MDVNDLVFNEKLQGNEQALQTLQALFPTEKKLDQRVVLVSFVVRC